MRNIVIFTLYLVLLFASTSEATKYAGEFLSLGVGGRALGMGSAYVALANDATAGYWNPAGLAQLTKRELILMHTEQFGDIANYDYGTYAQPYGENGTLSLSLIRLSIDDIAITENALNDQNGNGVLDPGETLDLDQISTGSDHQNALFFSYGRRLNNKLLVGGSVKVIYKSTLDYHAWGLGVDAGVIYMVTNGLTAGIKLNDATSSPLVWDTDESTTETIIPSLRWGIAYQKPIFYGQITATADIKTLFEGRETASQFGSGVVSGDAYLGLEYLFQRRLAFRMGYQEENMTFGAGLKMSLFQIDYAFVGHEDLDDSHRISAGIQF